MSTPIPRRLRPSGRCLSTAMVLVGCSDPLVPQGDASVVDVSRADLVEVATSDRADVTTAPDAASSRDVAAPRDVPATMTNPRCPDGRALPYPDAPEIRDEGPIPPLRFVTSEGTLSLADHYAPCETSPALLVVRTFAAWSGHSRWHAGHTSALRRAELGVGVRLVDLLVLGEQNLPATLDDLAPWRARYDAAPDALAIDPEYRLRPYFLAAARLPLVVVLDPRTMVPLTVQENPTQEELGDALAIAAARLRGAPRPALPSRERVDGRFSRDEWAFLQTMSPLAPPPRDPTNRVADDPRAARLGDALFHDVGLSSNGAVSCATCHAEAHDFADGRATGLGLRPLDRNSPSVRVSAYLRWQFWDGRADSLWSQALGPIESPEEMGGARTDVARRVLTLHRADYTALFGEPPALDDLARFPAGARPGTPAWSAMREEDRALVDGVFANVGKAIAAFERTLRPGVTPFDRFLAGDLTAMSEPARAGLRTFLDAGCAQCHFGPALSNDSFHNIGMPTGRRDGVPDQGRYAAVRPLLASVFRADGPFSDDRSQGAHLRGLARVDVMEGMFRTPTLRNVARTGPWGHGGTFSTLEAVVLHYADIATGHHREQSSAGDPDPHLVGFHRDGTSAERIAALLRAMSE